MANVQLKNGYTKIVNNLLEQFFIRDFSPIQLRILLMLIRFSYGCNKKTAKIKPQNLFNTAYVYEGDIKRELKHLERNKVITCNFENKTFALNKNFDEWKISFHKLFDEEKFAKLLHINLSCGLSENLVDNEETEETENETLLPSKENLSCGLSENLVDNEEMKAGNTDAESNSGTPKESINKEKENNNKYIYNPDDSLKTTKEKIFKIDPYINPYKKIFTEEYEKIFKRDCFLNNAQHLKLVEIAAEIPNFKELIPTLVLKFSKITFDFDGVKKQPGLRWLLEDGNWAGVLSGEFDSNIEDTQIKGNKDDGYSY
ncbi:MAG: hypothetical protein BHW55_07880 [Candidatus Melainabacteria bacterium 35_41]|nr:MAG: hypothetical protein BHW55_07880 [Candidatus Melainabacteria bacterium 35_41]